MAALRTESAGAPGVQWFDIHDPNDPQLDELAQRYHLHPLHIEDCRHGGQRAKVEEGADYLFVVLKPVKMENSSELAVGDLDVFVGRDYLITVQELHCESVRPRLEQIKAGKDKAATRPDQLFYRIMDELVDTYTPFLDNLSEEIDKIEDQVLETPTPGFLARIFDVKRILIELRRVLSNTRDVAGHLQRTETDLIQRDMAPFLRDVYDHLARNLDLVEMQRDLLSGAMDIYLSSVANRTNQVMKVLTVLGTIALPSIVISGFFGMNTKDLPFLNSPHGTLVAATLMVGATAALLYMLKRFDWW
jgi:magnesium transporter